MPVSNDVTTEAAKNNRHPLDDFWGTVEDINDSTRPQTRNPGKSNTFIKFDLSQLEIIKANEPFNFPVTSIEVMEINIPGSEWEVLKESLRKCGFTGGLNNFIGKRAHFKYTDAILNKPRTDGVQGYAMQPSYCWQVVEVEGVENTSSKLMDAIVELANGANAAEFKTKFMSEASIRTMTGFPDAMTAVATNTMLATLVASGKLTLNGDVYSKV